MDFKQSTNGEILESEREMVLKGAERYGDYFNNASDFNALLNQFVKSIDPDRFIFAMFLSQIRKHHTLALFSAIRLHRIQAMMDLRQVLEAGSCAAYAIAHTNQADFAGTNEAGLLDPSKKLAQKRYKWLERNFKEGSEAIKRMKLNINNSTAHSNIVYADSNFQFDDRQRRFETPFFDIEYEYLVKTDLWQIGNIAMGLMDLFYGINKGLSVIKFLDDFIPRLKRHQVDNQKLEAEMMGSERYKRIDEMIKGRTSQT